MSKVLYATRVERRMMWPYRFWSKIKIICDADSCWEWTGALYTCGYGKFRMPGPERIDRAAHIIAWRLVFGGIAPGLFVLHRCSIENKRCARLSHLYLGTKSDNALDYYRGTDRQRVVQLTQEVPK